MDRDNIPAYTSNLTRNYSIASLAGIVIVAVTLVYFYQHLATHSLTQRESQFNSDLARTLGNTIWTKYSNFFWHSSEMSADELSSSRVIEQIERDIRNKTLGLRVLQVKIYNLNGKIIFSTHPSQIGDNEYDNRGVKAALTGRTISEVSFRDSLSSLEGEIFDRNVITSYVPIRRSFDQPVEGVFEIYTDITPLLADVDKTSSQILLVITALMMVLFLFLMLFVRRAHMIIRSHEEAHEIEQKQRIDYLEYHDEVTGLLNRKGLLRQIHHHLTTEHIEGVGVGVIALKLRNLSAISGGLGHQRVIHLLRLVSGRISSCATGTQNISHLDSSEFVLIIENLISETELDFMVDKLSQLFAEPFVLDHSSITLSISIGADCSWGGKSHEALVNSALLALTECKVKNRQYVRYDESMELSRIESLTFEVEISRALQEHEFALYYQPKINLTTGEVSGMEALVRWHHPKRGVLSPNSFIGLLEERGYIVDLGNWLIEEACRQCKRWHNDGQSNLRVAVNVSLKQLQFPGFLQSVVDAIEISGIEPRYLELELTESMLADDTEVILDVMKNLKKMGVLLSIDDFGTGYSSLSYLMHYPFDYIKIDRSFIRDMMHNRDHAILTNAIIAMAKSLNLGVVAEGVETQQQLHRVREMGCDEVQGFYFSQAVEPRKFMYVVSGINEAAADVTNL
ncbi:MAG: bifunctional diguanylate cyclase/phosphodiesterase [Chromatiales bacterium]|nr:bifunctional diguanylate cyclase/phosphodiesterase [Chromatiales bacterium]